jgi:hypothetical protein
MKRNFCYFGNYHFPMKNYWNVKQNNGGNLDFKEKVKFFSVSLCFFLIKQRSDFRAGGVFALENLLYLAETYPVLFQLLLRGENHKEKFPLAISGFNLTMMLFEMIGWGMKTTLPETTQAKKAKHTLIRILFANDVTDTQIRFNELYCVVFDLFDQEWLALQANTLDFNQVKAGTKKKFENLAANSSSLQQIKQNSRCN